MSSIACVEKPSSKKIILLNLLRLFTLRGLGEILILYHGEHKTFLGKLFCDNGKHIIRDEGYLSGINADSLLPCWNNGILGAVCNKADAPWDSLTFFGLEHCDLKVDLSKTRHLALAAAEDQYGDHLIDFMGNIYQGFQLMLDNHFLPVVLLSQIRIISGEIGLAVIDLRAAPLPISVIHTVNNVVRESIRKHLTSGVDDIQVDPEQFDTIFHDYLPQTRGKSV
jgi:hypothetical protein